MDLLPPSVVRPLLFRQNAPEKPVMTPEHLRTGQWVLEIVPPGIARFLLILHLAEAVVNPFLALRLSDHPKPEN
jgi:hypothetical protein